MDILLASQNQHKYQEINDILKNTNIKLLSLTDFNDNDEVIEDGQTFAENALIKAQHYYKKYNIPVISDDSGLVTHYNGKPGIYSSRYAGNNASDNDNNLKLLKDMQDVNNREAYFICVICFIYQDKTYYFEGRLEGEIGHDLIGNEGFGYDPLFILKDGTRLSELKIHEKSQISHRAKALVKWANFLKEEGLFNE